MASSPLSSASTSTSAALSAYRALRRSLRASDIEDQGLVRALSEEFRRLLRQEVEEEQKNKESSSTTTTPTPVSASSLARDFASLLSAVKHQRELLLSHGIGIDRETRQMETVRRTAARVGLRLPEEEEEEGGGGKAKEG